jgi:uroporphyrinogen decarboxylase
MMRQAGRYLPEYREIRAKHAFLEVCRTPQLAVEVSIQPFRRLGVDAVIVFSDILIPAEAMGLHLELGDAGPNLPNPVRSKTDVDRLKIFDPEAETGFLPEAIRRIVKSVGPDVPVLGFAGAPWTLATYMVEGKAKEGFATVKSFLYREPKTFHLLLHRIAQATIPYLKAQIAAGAAAVQLFDTWCGELNLHDYEEFALPAVQEIISGLGGSVPVIYSRPWRALAQMSSASIGALTSRRFERRSVQKSPCKATSIPPFCSPRQKKFAIRPWPPLIPYLATATSSISATAFFSTLPSKTLNSLSRQPSAL